MTWYCYLPGHFECQLCSEHIIPKHLGQGIVLQTFGKVLCISFGCNIYFLSPVTWAYNFHIHTNLVVKQVRDSWAQLVSSCVLIRTANFFHLFPKFTHVILHNQKGVDIIHTSYSSSQTMNSQFLYHCIIQCSNEVLNYINLHWSPMKLHNLSCLTTS